MRERPILFSAPMVRAILAGTKTQTRRVVKLPHLNPLGQWEPFRFGGEGCRDSKGREISGQMTISHTRTGEVIGCPYGVPGDRLWVREAWADLTESHGRPYERHNTATGLYERGTEPFVWHRADGEQPDNGSGAEKYAPWRPSIHMPRLASRIDLEITGVRVERLQDISAEDCIAEGMQSFLREHDAVCDLQDQFRALWDSIHGKPVIERDSEGREIARRMFDWAANPWVWVVEFRRIKSAKGGA
mgnify:CR=1